MIKYLRLLRLQDQYTLISSVLISALYLHSKQIWVITWSTAVLLFSFTAFMLNELVDREDVDKYSWNKIHINLNDKFNSLVLMLMFSIFSISGLWLSWVSKLFWFGFFIWIIGILYSLKPIRFKSRFGLDIIAQIMVWFILPILGPVKLYGNLSIATLDLIPAILLFWGMSFPYQLADFIADKKAGIKGTHIVLGMKNSLKVGELLTLFGLFLFFGFKLYQKVPWSILFILISIYTVAMYFHWLKLNSLEKQIKSLQNHVFLVRRFGYLFVPYLLLWLWL